MKRRTKSKKAMYWDLKTIILMLIVLGISLYVLWRFVIQPYVQSITPQTGCAARKGTCIAASADCDGGLKIPGMCEKKDDICCINTL